MSALQNLLSRLKSLRQRQFFKDTVVLQASTLVQGATYFITSVLTKQYLGLHEMGRWVSVRELFMFAYFFVSMGVVNATVSRYSEAVGRQDRQAGVQTLAAMLKVGGLCALLVLVLGFTLGPSASEYFFHDREIGWWAAILSISGLFEVLRGITVAALQGTRQMREYAWFDITTNTLRVFIVWAALAWGYGLPGVVVAFLVHMLLAGALALWWYHKARDGHAKLAPPPLSEVLAAVPRAKVGHIFGVGYLLALNKGMNTLVPRIGMLVIPAVGVAAASTKAFEDNAAYSIGHVLSWGLGLAMAGVTQTLLPALGLKVGAGQVPFDQLGGYLRRISLWTGTAMAAVTLLSVIPVYFVIHKVYGADAGDAFEYYLWLASGNLFLGFAVVVDAFYIYSGKLKQAIPWNFLMAAIALAGIAWGAHAFGPIGVAAASGLCRGLALFHLVYIWVYFRRAKARSRSP
ncbi:MAG: lipopolysaccharide biosynthesis protein [Planctomycetota bacterium]